jgi:hypothetical protein
MTTVLSPEPVQALVLLRGKELTMPIEIEALVVGLALGLVIGLFYYQYYRKSYYWWYSLGTGAISAFLCLKLLQRIPGFDAGELSNLLLEFVIPLALTLGVNHYFYLQKKRASSKRRRVQQGRSVSSGEIPRVHSSSHRSSRSHEDKA